MNKRRLLGTVALLSALLVLGLSFSRQVNAAVQISGPPGAGWTPIFADEFNGSSLDTSKWNTCFHWALENNFNYCRAGNDELQWYQPDDISIQNGLLRLKAEKRQLQGANYTSGMIASDKHFSYRYGYAEARFRVPKGKGFWPAFWTLPKDNSWPPEIDIMEILGDRTTTAYNSLHWGATNNSTTKAFNGPDFAADFHTFAADWEPGLIVWYIDGIEVFRQTQNIPDKEMYLILNLAVGGSWPGSPDANTVFPATFDVDYVRVWQRQNSAPTATATSIAPSAMPTVTAIVPSATPTATTISTDVPATEIPTEIPTATATDLPASATPTATVTSTTVAPSASPTVTLAATITPTATLMLPGSTPTLTPTANGPMLIVEVNPLTAGIGSTVSAVLKLSNVTNLYGLQAECTADPKVLSGAGHTEGVIFTAKNSFIVDTGFQSDGKWSTAGSLLNPAPAFTGGDTAYSLNYQVVGAGHTDITCSVLAVDVTGNLLPVSVVNGAFDGTDAPAMTPTFTAVPPTFTPAPPTATLMPTVSVTVAPTLTAVPGAVSGTVSYEKRADQSGITVELMSGTTQVATGTTAADGSFQFNNVPTGSYVVTFSAAGYLGASAPVEVQAGQGATVQVTLVAGDVDGSGTVDLTDAAFVGANYRLQVPPAPAQADLNGDGFVNLVDLVLVGKNFGKAKQ